MITLEELRVARVVLEKLGPAVLKRRTDLGVTQRAVAYRAGVSSATINRIERGHIPNGTSLPLVLNWLKQTQWIEDV